MFFRSLLVIFFIICERDCEQLFFTVSLCMKMTLRKSQYKQHKAYNLCKDCNEEIKTEKVKSLKSIENDFNKWLRTKKGIFDASPLPHRKWNSHWDMGRTRVTLMRGGSSLRKSSRNSWTSSCSTRCATSRSKTGLRCVSDKATWADQENDKQFDSNVQPVFFPV